PPSFGRRACSASSTTEGRWPLTPVWRRRHGRAAPPREHADGLAHALSVANRMPGRYRSEPRRVRALRHCPEREQRGIEGEQSSWALAKSSRLETHTLPSLEFSPRFGRFCLRHRPASVSLFQPARTPVAL